MTETETRLRAMLGIEELDHAVETDSAWIDGFGIVSPEVTRYADVLRADPDAVQLAIRNLGRSEGITLLDPDSANLLSLLTRSLHPLRVLEAGTTLGLVTLTLARAVPDDCTIVSVEADPILQGYAHAFLEHHDLPCAVELRLGDTTRVLRDVRDMWDMIVLTDPALPRLEILDAVASQLAPDGLLIVPFALRGGRVAHGATTWGETEAVDEQRALNRAVASDMRFTDVTLLPVGDGLLIARRTH